MIPWLIFAVVIVPLVVIAFVVSRRRTTGADQSVDDPGFERQFADAEAYEAEWHEKDEERFRKERLP